MDLGLWCVFAHLLYYYNDLNYVLAYWYVGLYFCMINIFRCLIRYNSIHKGIYLAHFFFDLFQDFTLKCPKKNLILHNVCFNGIEKITYL